ncbi:MAG: L,D-transpeptidase family protein, partial [Chitinophagaceae bacterium]
MKIRTHYTALLVLLIVSCHENADKKNNDNPELEDMDESVKNTKPAKKVTDRDYSITGANAYNDVFMDSMAMEKYILNHQLGDKKIGLRIRSFYNARNYQYAWFTPKGLTEHTRLFWNQYDYAVTHLKDTVLANSTFYKQAEKIVNQEQINFSNNDTNLLNTEFAFTENFIRYIHSTYEKGYVKRKEQEKFIPIKKLDPLKMADSLLNKKHSDDKYYEEVNEMYAGLKKELHLYYSLAKSGGWPTVPSIKQVLKKGDTLNAITAIKKRLQSTKDMPGHDSSNLFTDTLETAVKKFQTRHGYKADGTISGQLIKDMNVPAGTRLKEILL